jgi:hypothetical protein
VIGDAAEVKANIILVKKLPVTNGNKRRSLTIKRNVQLPEITHNRIATGSMKCIAITQLKCQVLIRLMKNGMTV